MIQLSVENLRNDRSLLRECLDWQGRNTYKLCSFVGIILLGSAISSTTTSQNELADLQFQVYMQGSGVIEGGGRFDSCVFKSQDGVIVERIIQTYRSPELAKEKMDAKIAHAVKIIERGAKRSSEGLDPGERVVVSFRFKHGEDLVFLVLWKERANVYIVQSKSLRHAIAFENWHYPKEPPQKP